MGGSVTASGLTTNALCGDWTGINCAFARDPHFPSLSSLHVVWPSLSATYSNQIPTSQGNVSYLHTVQFRIAVDYRDSQNPVGQAQDFSVRLRDTAGNLAVVKASDYTRVLYYPPAGTSHRATVMSSVRIPLRTFAGVQRTRVSSVEVLFNQKSTGGILVSDLAFTDGITVPEEWVASSSLLF
jgi:hypothetical protein